MIRNVITPFLLNLKKVLGIPQSDGNFKFYAADLGNNNKGWQSVTNEFTIVIAQAITMTSRPQRKGQHPHNSSFRREVHDHTVYLPTRLG